MTTSPGLRLHVKINFRGMARYLSRNHVNNSEGFQRTHFPTWGADVAEPENA
jgi:hypothetical protein